MVVFFWQGQFPVVFPFRGAKEKGRFMERAWRRVAFRFAWAWVLYMLGVGAAFSAPIPWRQTSVAYVSKGKPLRQVLKDILATQAFPVVIANDLRGEVNGEFNEPAPDVFRNLAAAYDFIWYFDGAVLYINSSNDVRSEVIPIAPLRAAQATQVLTRLGLIEARFPINAAAGSVLVTGPSRYVNLVVKALTAEREYAVGIQAKGYVMAPRGAGGAKGLDEEGRQIQVFPLKYAQAQDVSRSVGGVSYTVPGVASILRRLLAGASPVPLAADVNSERATGAGEVRRFNESVPGVLSGLASDGVRNRGDEHTIERGRVSPQIEADVRTNSVVVYDRPEAMAYYANAIERLDRPQKLVQIDITIIDIVSSAIRDLGVDLSLKSSHISGSTNSSPGDLGGASFQGVIGNSTKHLTVRLAALEKSGKARVLSRPKVLTLDNIEALLGSQSTAYARVAGAYSADLFPINAGLQVRATPQVVASGAGGAQIRLLLNISDGRFDEAAAVDGIPVSNQNYIATQALVEDGQTLLIGGYQYENVGDVLSGVPFLSRVPLLGPLFRRTTKKHERTERLFLITPQIVPDLRNDSAELAGYHRNNSAAPLKSAGGDVRMGKGSAPESRVSVTKAKHADVEGQPKAGPQVLWREEFVDPWR